MALVILDFVRNGVLLVCGEAVHMMRHRIEARLSHIAAPTLRVRGEKDPIAPAGWLHALAARSVNVRGITVARAAHGAPYSAPEALAEAIMAFMEAMNRSSP